MIDIPPPLKGDLDDIFVESRLKDIFHWSANLHIFSISFIRFVAGSLTFLTAEYRDVSLAESLVGQQS